jgi:tetratricopeptide (TPR) repeat protein
VLRPHRLHFTDREDVFDAIRERFKDSHACVVALTGLAGVGKSQIAAEFVWSAQDCYEGAWWVSAMDGPSILRDCLDLADRLGLDFPEPLRSDHAAALAAILDSLSRRPGRFLLVLDGAERRTVGLAGGGYEGVDVLIASHDPSWGEFADPITVNPLSNADAASFLKVRSGGPVSDDWTVLASRLGELPLALEQCAAFIEQTGVEPHEYVELLATSAERLMQLGTPQDYPVGLAAAWQLSYRGLAGINLQAATLLDLVSLFDSSPIPVSGLQPGVLAAPEELGLPHDELGFASAIGSLRQFSLVDRFGGFISVHPLVQLITRQRMQDATRLSLVETAARILCFAFPSDSRDVIDWMRWMSLIPHGVWVDQLAEELGASTAVRARLLVSVGICLLANGAYQQACAVMERAEGLAQLAHGEDSPDYASVLVNLSMAEEELDRFDSALSHLQKALGIDEAALGGDHPNVARDYGRLGAACLRAGRFDEALTAVRTAVETIEKVPGADPLQIAYHHMDLATVLYTFGRLGESRQLFRKAEGVLTEHYDRGHPAMARLWGNLGMLLIDSGEYGDAESVLMREVEILEAVYPEGHPEMSKAYINLGSARQELGRLGEAKSLYEKALTVNRRIFGDLHTSVADALNNLGSAASEAGNPEEAEGHYRAALAIDEQIRGPLHPVVAVRLNNLGSLMSSLGRYDEAIQLQERALEIELISFGDDHPRSARFMQNLASSIRMKGLGLIRGGAGGHMEGQTLLHRAAELVAQAGTINAEHYGPDHPSVGRDEAILGALLHDQREIAEAVEHLQRSLDIGICSVGDTHPDVADRRLNLGRALRDQGKLREAREQFREALRIFIHYQGVDGPRAKEAWEEWTSAPYPDD